MDDLFSIPDSFTAIEIKIVVLDIKLKFTIYNNIDSLIL